jgi:ribosomal protein S12 methylthiotransferase
MRTVALCNLGCSKNRIDGERILARFRASGHAPVTDFSRADTILVNTCAFIKTAKQEAIEAILHAARFKKSGRCTALVVAGCFSERFRNEAHVHFPEVDAWLGVHDWPALLGSLLGARRTAPGRVLFPPRATQYLKIAEGCSRRCGFCAIPAIRGPFKSRTERDVVAEARWLYSRGVKECILVSQDTTSYGRDRGGSLAGLLKLLLAKTDFPWIRLMYLHPQSVSGELLSLFANEKRLLPYFDIPLQHISDDILRSMNRRPLSNGVRKLIAEIRAVVPGAALRTTFIAGYPGETARHFRELLDFVEETGFDRLGVFPFSPEEGTPAFSLPGRPAEKTAQDRCERIMALQRVISAKRCASLVGKTVEVIVDGSAPKDALSSFPKNSPAAFSAPALAGRTIWDAPEVDGTVLLPARSAKVGAIVKARVVSSSDYDLAAVPLPR